MEIYCMIKNRSLFYDLIVTDIWAHSLNNFMVESGRSKPPIKLKKKKKQSLQVILGGWKTALQLDFPLGETAQFNSIYK